MSSYTSSVIIIPDLSRNTKHIKIQAKVTCPKCNNQQIYNVRKTIPKHPKTQCKTCKYFFYIRRSDLKPIKRNQKNIKKNQESKKGNKEVSKDLLPLPKEDPGFFWFCRWVSFPRYKGLFNWQKEHYMLTKDAKYEMTLVPRDHGKSVEYTERYEYMMWYKGYDVLLLGWTDRRKEIALFVYTFFHKYGLIETDKRTSPYHFRLTNGAKFDCYLISGKEVLGMHSLGKEERFADLTPEDIKELKAAYDPSELASLEDGLFDDKAFENFIKDRNRERKLWISIDDPLDISFMKERYREEELELRFSSTLYSINPNKWSFTGTHKFEGDIFDFWIGRFGSKLVIYKKPPILPDGSLLCPEMFTHPSLSTYDEDLKAEKKDLDEIRQHIGEYAWSSDWCQEPHPVTGDVWEFVDYVYTLDTPIETKHDLCFITVDRATTRKTEATKKKADYTGCVIGLRELKTGFKIITHDFTDYIDIDDLILKINDFVFEFHQKHKKIMIVLIVETQGGGSDFVTLIRNSAHFIREDGTIVKNYIRDICFIEELHNKGDKKQRIKDRLGAPLKNLIYKFLTTLEKFPIVNQILSFPNCNKFDAIDGLANVEFILLVKYFLEPGEKNRIEQTIDLFNDYEKGILESPLDEKGTPMDKDFLLKFKRDRDKRKTVF